MIVKAILVILILYACEARYLVPQDVLTASPNSNLQSLNWRVSDEGIMSLKFKRKTYVKTAQLATCCFEAPIAQFGFDYDSPKTSPAIPPAKAEFIFHVGGDGKDHDSHEYVEISSGGTVLASHNFDQDQEWGGGSPRIVVPFTLSANSDLSSFGVKIRHSPNGNDDFEFSFQLKLYHGYGNVLYDRQWGGTKVSKDSNERFYGLGSFSWPFEYQQVSVEKYVDSLDLELYLSQVQNVLVSSLMMTTPDCASNQYYDGATCKACDPLCKSCWGPDPNTQCFDCTYGKGPDGNCCPKWCATCDGDNVCGSCVAHSPIYNYWDGVCYRPVELSEYFFEGGFYPCHERCLTCTAGGPEDCIICRYGRGLYDNQCCPPFCEKCDYKNKCTLCLAGFLQYKFQCYKQCTGNLVGYDVLTCVNRDINFVESFPLATADNKGYKLNNFNPSKHFFSQTAPSYANSKWKCQDKVSGSTIGDQGSFLSTTAMMLRIAGMYGFKGNDINPNTIGNPLSKKFIDDKCGFIVNFDRVFSESPIKYKKRFLLIKSSPQTTFKQMSEHSFDQLYEIFDFQKIYEAYSYLSINLAGITDKYLAILVWKVMSTKEVKTGKDIKKSIARSSHSTLLLEWKNYDSTKSSSEIFSSSKLTVIDPLAETTTRETLLCSINGTEKQCLKEILVYEIKDPLVKQTDKPNINYGSPDGFALTFNLEVYPSNLSKSCYFTVPSSNSGVTIGAGYDLKEKTKEEVQENGKTAGLSNEQIQVLIEGIGKVKEEAQAFKVKYATFHITENQQRSLHGISYSAKVKYTEGLLSKYWKIDFKTLAKNIKEVLVDLAYKGNFMPKRQKELKIALLQAVEKKNSELLIPAVIQLSEEERRNTARVQHLRNN